MKTNNSMVNLEVRGAKQIVEACSMTSSVRRCVFTSSLAACIWQHHGFSVDSEFLVDEKCWSNHHLCTENKIWLALSKTMSEKVAWKVADERRGVNLVTLYTSHLTRPAFSASCASSLVAYLKGGREMYKKKLFVIVGVRREVEAHVCLYEEMESGGSNLSFHSQQFDTPDEVGPVYVSVVRAIRKHLLHGNYEPCIYSID